MVVTWWIVAFLSSVHELERNLKASGYSLYNEKPLSFLFTQKEAQLFALDWRLILTANGRPVIE